MDQAKTMAGAYLFVGSEDFLKENRLRYIVSQNLSPDQRAMNLQQVDGEEAAPNIIDVLETVPLFAEKRILVVKNAAALVEGLDSKSPFYKKLEQLPQSSLLLLVEGEKTIKKSSKLYKSLNGKGRIIHCDPLKGKALRDFVAKTLARGGQRIKPAAVELFLQRSGYEQGASLMELYQQLQILISLGDGSIPESLILEALPAPLEDNIFDFLDALRRGAGREVMDTKKELLQKEEPVGRIFYMILRQFRNAAGLKGLMEEGMNLASACASLGIKTYEGKRLAPYAQSITWEELRWNYQQAMNFDRQQKTTSHSEEVVLDLFLSAVMHGGKDTESSTDGI